ncbi:MAG: secondary thiamine-phosphate synthase enzyme YjbQ [Candidatus Diapherotrites archaeon]|nr:secondary thiamine-phosphate synthase enzyme YjbQ [Candidatus Diapherotrites archaeon]
MISEFAVKSAKRVELIDVTKQVQSAVAKSKVMEGLCIVYCPHTTAAITINENADPAVQTDIIEKLNELVPPDAGYSHTEGNADAHIKAAVIGNCRVVLVRGGKLLLGAWEGIFFCEFDGPRERRLLVLVK